MATAISSLTVEELKDIVTKSIDQKLQESMGKETFHNSQNHPQNPSPNRQDYNNNNNNNTHYRNTPRFQNYQNSTPHYNNNNPSYNNSSYNNPSYNNNYQTRGTPRTTHHQNSTQNNIRPYNNQNSYNNNQNSYHSNQNSHGNQNSPNKYYNQRRFHEVQPLKIMITYVETACTFWGQVLTPDLLDTTRQLETDLQDMCPGLPPVAHITKGGLYGTMWCERWYRCITCQIPDEQGNTDVLFVDYGNKEKKNIADLVALKSPKLLEVPFFAYPFRFPKLEALPDKLTEAVGSFDTESILTGFVSQTPLPDLYTDIYVNRPQLTNQPSCTTYNELMVELGFAKKSEESATVRRTQPSYYTQALHQRIKMLSTLCRDKDLEMAKLCGDQPPDTPARSPFHDIRYAESNGDSTPTQTTSPSQSLTEVVKDKNVVEDAVEVVKEEVVTEEDVKIDLVKEDVVTEEIVSEKSLDPVESIEEQIQIYILSLIDKIDKYNSTAADIVTGTDTRAIKSVLEQLQSVEVSSELADLRSSVEMELESLTQSSAAIQGCADSASLERAVEKRDANLLAVSEAVELYTELAEQSELKNKFQLINEIVAAYEQPQADSGLPEQSLDSLLDGVDEMSSGFLSDVIKVQGNCREHLTVLNGQLVSCSRLLSNNTVRLFGESKIVEVGEDSADENGFVVVTDQQNDKENITSLGNSLKTVCSLLEELLTTSQHHYNDLSPVSASVRGVVKERAVKKREELELFVTSSELYQKRALSARQTLQNKPDLSNLTDIKKQLKTAKRQVKLSQITDDDEDEESSMRESMINLHKLYKTEETEFANLLDLAQTTHPELLIQHPQLKAMSQGDHLLKTSWELHEFVLPDTSACINSQGLNVYCGFYSDLEPVYFVERALQTVEGRLEEHALQIIRETLSDNCFAVIINKKSLRVYGATTQPLFKAQGPLL